MADYILPHSIPQEDERLTLMSRMLDPQLFFRLEQVGVAAGWRCLEVGAGNGSVSHWLAERVGPRGHVVCSDIDTRFLSALEAPNLEVRRIDVTTDLLGEDYDLVLTRALLHHVPQRIDVLHRLAAAVRPGGILVVEEPDFHPVLATDSPALRDFWEGFLAWAASEGIDYFVGRRVAPQLAASGFDAVAAHGETILFAGGSLPARYLALTMRELERPLLGSGLVGKTTWTEAMRLLDNEAFWTWQNCYVTTTARRPETAPSIPAPSA
ncbi:MAG TPA: class I SAM-dependent methyltransferase [Microbacterium sp.]|nr:class I SAM-dependent methyltransferase [Microbacterium sp.]